MHIQCFIYSRAEKGVCDRDGQGQVHRLPFVSHGWGQSSSPRYRCMLDHVLHVACQVMSSCFFVFPVRLKVGVEHLTEGPDEFLPRKVCASFCCGCSCAFVCIVSYTAGHIKECDRDGQGQVRRLPFVSHGWDQSSFPRYRCMHSNLSSQVIMFLLLSCTVEGGGRVSRTRNRKIPPQEGVCIFAVATGFRRKLQVSGSPWPTQHGTFLQTSSSLQFSKLMRNSLRNGPLHNLHDDTS